MRTVPYRSAAEREEAADELRRHLHTGGLIAYPTETVYGFGCVPDPPAIERLARLKRRAPAKPFLLLVRSPDDARGLDWNASARRLADRFWPGPLTLILADPAGSWPVGVRGPDGTVALRVSSHPAVAAILAAADGPVTSTSANLPGDAAATDAAGAARAAGAGTGREGEGGILVLDGGALPPSPSSTIVDCTAAPARLVRAGALSLERLGEVVEIQDD